MPNIQPDKVFTIKVSDQTVFEGMKQTRFTGYDTSLFFANDVGDVVPATAIIRMKIENV